jgi:Anti-sigma-K factor rskA, C-terminal
MVLLISMKSNMSVANHLATVIALVLVAALFTVVQLAHAQQINIDVTKPTGDKPFGGEKIGTVSITPQGHVVKVVGNMTSSPSAGKVYEGWFVDAGGSGYKLSLGEFAKNGTIHFDQQMVNPFTYTQFMVTEEPFEDVDPNAGGAVGGAQLQAPFTR